MKKYFLFFIITSVLIPFVTNAQREMTVDSIKQAIRISKTDSATCYWMDVLAKKYSGVKPDSGIYYANKSLELAKKINKPEYQVDAYNSLGIIYREMGEFDLALKNLHEALSIINTKKIDPWYLERIYTSLNLAYTEQGNYTAGIEYGFKSLHEIEKSGDTMNMAMSNNNLANTFFNLKQHQKALKHYKIALNYAIKLKHLYGQTLLNGNLGSVYFEMGKIDSAKIYYDKSLELAKQIEDIMGEAIAYGNIGSYYQQKKENQKAIEYFLKAEKIFIETQMQPNLSDMYYNIATSYLQLNNYTLSLQYAQKSLDIANKIGSNPHKQQSHLALKNAYEHLNNIPKAYYHYQEYIAAKDSIFNEENRKAQFKSEIVYEYNKKHYADSLNQNLITKIQEEELAHEKEKNETQLKFTYTAIAGFILMLLLAIYIFKGYKDKQKANKIIALQKDLVEEKQREIIDSIHYAKRIQQSLMPTEKYIEKHLKSK
jgi:tetratricopeptide (TPR) repeat protein